LKKEKKTSRAWLEDWVRRRDFIIAIAGSASLWPLVVRAQQPTNKISIGFLSVNVPSAMKARIEAFQQGLRELGYVDRQNILIEYRFAEGKPDRLRALAGELVRLNVSVIVSEGPTSTRFAKEATSAIPIVMAQDPDPVGTGFVASLARPGGNITGLSNLRSDLGGKRLAILRDTIPGLTRVAIIGTSTTPGNREALADVVRAASTLALRLQVLEVSGPQDIETAFQAATADGHADAVLALASPYLLSNRTRVIDVAAKSRIPTMYYTSEYVREGGLMSYGVSATDLFRRAASYVDKIIKGARAGDLPIEQPAKFEFIINLPAAKSIGLTIPRNVFDLADEVIE
jgi:putative tryptophan/tyrosine transport system substrate-binding protein